MGGRRLGGGSRFFSRRLSWFRLSRQRVAAPSGLGSSAIRFPCKITTINTGGVESQIGARFDIVAHASAQSHTVPAVLNPGKCVNCRVPEPVIRPDYGLILGIARP